ncbi:TMAO reductase system periplasmic protein TorT [Shewanella sp. KCT]|uniref:TMAO reductase system periplasmic protein TorT n=1 Tax=Shewanella sp. KCT TaxID=2569535 RepID=UPI0011820885|nr:TMAO reductase system periplasmic protein TorT [Shewanella sp. KCT]
MVKHNKSPFFRAFSLWACLNGLAISAGLAISVTANASETWSLERRTPYNAKLQQVETLSYRPLSAAKRPWRLCALVPHLKDAYWIGIDYGLVTRAQTLGVALELFEAGSYYGKVKQLEQLEHCMKSDFDAILLGTVDPELLKQYQGQISKPMLALVNRLDSPLVSTRIGVNWYQMGWHAGDYIHRTTAKQPGKANTSQTSTSQTSTGQAVQLALLLGPEKLGGSTWVEQGIMAALEGSTVTISSNRHADNNRDLYRDQLHHLLKDHRPDYILGSAVAIEAAIGALAQQDTAQDIALVSSYLSPATLRGLYRHRVAFSSDDQVVLQGKLAIDVVVRELEGAAPFGDIGPGIKGLTPDNIQMKQLADSLAPADFYPIYRVEAPKATPQP